MTKSRETTRFALCALFRLLVVPSVREGVQRSGIGRSDRHRRRRLQHERRPAGGVLPEHPSPHARDRLPEDDRRRSEERLHPCVVRF